MIKIITKRRLNVFKLLVRIDSSIVVYRRFIALARKLNSLRTDGVFYTDLYPLV